MKGEILPPLPVGPKMELKPPPGLSDEQKMRFWGGIFTKTYSTGVWAFVAAGRVLIEAKAEFGEYGKWVDWLEDHTPISQQTAAQLMRVARDPNISRHVEVLSHGNTLLPDDRRVLDEICGLEPERFDGLIEEGVIHAEMRRGDLKRHLVAREHEPPAGEPPPLPDGKYGAIMADPPWRFEARGPGGKGRSADNHYPTMTLDEIISTGARAVAADDAALFLWVTSEMLQYASGVMNAWGFELKSTAFIWVKDGAPGLGYWTRKQAEICLLGTRGSPKRLNADVAEVIHAPRGPHSRKPGEVYGRIERLVAGPYLELFGRGRQSQGWDVWGNDPALREEAE